MDGKIIAIVPIVAGIAVGIAAAGVGVYFLVSGNGKAEQKSSEPKISNNSKEEKVNRKTLVVYYSAQEHTKAVAEKVAKNLDADIYEIVPESVYTEDDLNWNNPDSRVTREHEDESLHNVPLKSTMVPNWAEYDTILLGYPIWWAIAAWPTDTFVKSVDWNGKTVIPFCTSYSSNIGESDDLLKAEANGGDWQDGFRFFQNASDEEIKNWTDNLK